MLINDLFLGVGAMKAGTTWITEHLSSHPKIHFSYEKELSYFSYIHNDESKFFLSDENRMDKITGFINIASTTSIDNMRDIMNWSCNYLSNPIDDQWYVNNFSLKDKGKFCADFSNLYSHIDDVGWDHIKSITKNLKVIYIMRNPIERMWSHVKFQLEIDGRLDEAKNWTKEQLYEYSNVEHIIRNSKYTKVIRTLKKNLDDKQLLVLFYDDIIDAPAMLLNNIEKFLNIEQREYNIGDLNKKVNASENFEMPGFFNELFNEILIPQIENLSKFNIIVPGTWFLSGENI
jgi:hypothetical protein